jgi:hypothetical protein
LREKTLRFGFSSTKGAAMQTFPEPIPKTIQPGETPVETYASEDMTALTSESEAPPPRIPDDVPEADFLEQSLPA